jgi:methionyl-tRNA formyltransferase
MNLLFTGSGEFGVPTLRALVAGPHRVVQVVSQPDRPAGRGRGLTPTPISQTAIELALPLIRTENVNAETLPPADLMVVIAFGQKVAESIIHHPTLGSINLHASRLPRYRGAAPINWAIINGEQTTGNSIIRLAQKMDAGAVLGQSEIRISPTETAGELHDRLARDGVGLVLKVISELEAGTAIEIEQDHALATLSPKLSRASAKLDFALSAIELARRICGLYPWPGCRVKMCDATGMELARLRLVRARPGPTEGPRWEPGEIMGDGLIQTGDGGLEMVHVQPDSGNVMSMEDYHRGHRWPPGARLMGME